ncbi:unnamed protein product [Adineta steineri]|uniref:Uncharacterized protein n=1 Tax=Adineta steineri TaxID=433720 RepID=A0A815S477_9BILA|nr:unnamed protein product [Adineta steineri]CAF4158750.1 unnamed protein product [Adineta steineri]
MASIEYLTETNKSDALCSSTPSLSTVVNTTTTSSSTIICKRIGCENPSIDHPEWDGEFCSAQCLSIVCKEAFEQWVKKHQ